MQADVLNGGSSLTGSLPANIADYPSLAQDELAEHGEAIRQRKNLLHSLGNLTLLNRYLNPAASNGPFDLKLVEYKNSILRLNRHFDSQTEWDEQAIAHIGAANLARLFARFGPPRLGRGQRYIANCVLLLSLVWRRTFGANGGLLLLVMALHSTWRIESPRADRCAFGSSQCRPGAWLPQRPETKRGP